MRKSCSVCRRVGISFLSLVLTLGLVVSSVWSDVPKQPVQTAVSAAAAAATPAVTYSTITVVFEDGALDSIKSALKLPDYVEVKAKLYYKWGVVSPNVVVYHEFGGSGGGKIDVDQYLVPGWSIDIPYCKTGVFVSAKLTLGVGLSITGQAQSLTQRPVKFNWSASGGPSFSGSVGGGLMISAGVPNWAGVSGEVRGTASASGKGTTKAPPASVNFSGNVGKLTLSGYVNVFVLNKVVWGGAVTKTVWNGIDFNKTISLAVRS